MSNPMALTLSQFNTGVTNFNDHYVLNNCVKQYGGKELQISWDDFAPIVNSFIANHEVSPASVALRFVYCFNEETSSLYLRMQLLTMSPDGITPGTFILNNVPNEWFAITANGISATQDNNLFDTPYQQNVYFCATGVCTEQGIQKIADVEDAALTVTFPWQAEINQLFVDNGNPQGASVCFESIAMPQEGQGPAFQHTLAIFLKNADGVALLNDLPTSGFEAKAADMGTLCPTMCGVYVTPNGL